MSVEGMITAEQRPAGPASLGALFLTFLKIGSIAFGGGFMALISVVQNCPP